MSEGSFPYYLLHQDPRHIGKKALLCRDWTIDWMSELSFEAHTKEDSYTLSSCIKPKNSIEMDPLTYHHQSLVC